MLSLEASPVALTERAAARIAEILRGQTPGTALRISVEGGGCSGFSYKFVLSGERLPDDLIIEKQGAVAVIDALSLPFLQNAEIDFIDDLMGQSFQVKNPNATANCGCGTSFSI